MSVSVLIASEFELPPATEAAWLSQLPPTRQAELLRQTREARGPSLLGSQLLRAGLQALGHAPGALALLQHSPRDKPTLALPVHFSLSHCAGRVVCALSTEGPVGIDVEALGARQAGEFPRYLNAAERAWAGRSTRRFYALWTRKEAVAKAAGAGLRGLPEVDASAGIDIASFRGLTWRTPRVPVGRGHVAHLALPDRHAPVSIRRISRRQLERDAGLPLTAGGPQH